MIRGYVSSDEDDYDDDNYDFGYSDSFIVTNSELQFPEIQTKEGKEKLQAVLDESNKIDLFFKAVDLADLSTLEELITSGVSPDCTDTQKWTPLIRACGSGNVDVVQFLLQYGADANKHRELFTPLMTCCTYTLVGENLKLDCVRLLLENGAQVNEKDKYRTTALMYACGSNYTDIVNKLLEVPGIELDVQDKEGWTALFYAVNNNNIDLVNQLVSAGSNTKLKDRYERTVLNLALDKDFKEIAEALGYVEEEIPVVEEIISLEDRFLKELPDSKGQGGFIAEALNILHAFNQFNVKSISLPDLLNATEKDLYKIGVKLQPDRRKILSEGIHRYHLLPWKSSSIHQITPGVPLSMEDAIAITGALAIHLTIANASLRYLDTRISSRKNKVLEDSTVVKETIFFCTISYNYAKILNTSLSRIIKRIEKIKPEIPADYIYPYQEEKHRRKFFKIFWCLIGAATAGVFIFNCKSGSRFKTLFKFKFYHLLSLLPIFESEYISDVSDIFQTSNL